MRSPIRINPPGKGLFSALGKMKKYTPLDSDIRGGMWKATLGFNPESARSRANAPLPTRGAMWSPKVPPPKIGNPFKSSKPKYPPVQEKPLPLPPGKGTLVMSPDGMMRRTSSPRGQYTQPKIGPMPKPKAPWVRTVPPKPTNRGDQLLAIALSKKPRRG